MTTYSRTRAGRIGKYIALGLYVLFLAAPLFWLVSVSFKSNAELFDLTQSWIPRDPTLDNFIVIFDEFPLVTSLLNSLIVSTASAAGSVLLGTPIAYVMARQRSLITKGTTAWILGSQMLPFITILVPLFLLIIRLGLYDTREALILVYIVWSLPFAVWMLRNYIRSIPVELEQAAALDRANSFQIMFRIIGPLALPGLIVAFLFAFIQAWNEFFFALVIIKNPDLAPLSLMLVRFIGNDAGVRMGPLAAASLLSAIPNLILFAFLQRRLVQGLLGGSVRG